MKYLMVIFLLVGMTIPALNALGNFKWIDDRVMYIAGLCDFIGFFGILYFIRKKQTDSGQENEGGDYRKRFGDVPAAIADAPPRPIDFTGNVFEHNDEILREDFKKMESNLEEDK